LNSTLFCLLILFVDSNNSQLFNSSSSGVHIRSDYTCNVSKPKGPFEVVDRDIPEPGATQVRIKVQACGICHGDSFTKEGLFPGIQYPRGLGLEIAGVIDAVGKDVAEWKRSQRVAVNGV